jgi:aryl-alcohol dehydrogenase-like predicted oxidoreductase
MLKRDKMEVEFVPLFEKYGLGTTIWSPLCQGILTGRFNSGEIPEDSRFSTSKVAELLKSFFWSRIENAKEVMVGKLQALGQLAADNGVTQSQLALAWTMKNPDVSTAIFGSSRISQHDENLGAMDLYRRMTPELLTQIEEILDNRPTPPLNWRTWQPFPPRR